MHRPADLPGFAAAIDALRADLDAAAGPADVRHLTRIAAWARAFTALGYATAWVCPNPVAAVALAFGTFVRWAVLAHHTLHRGYDRLPGVPERFTSRGFARGWRRAVDWLDWLAPDAWRHEHNQLHHYHLNEDPGDPDLVEALVAWHGAVPRPVRWLLLAVYAVAWKPLFYAPNTLRLHLNAAARRRDPSAPQVRLGAPCLVNPLHPYGRRVWLRCWLPYAAWRFGVAPALFLPLGGWAWLSVLVNTLAAEAVTNAWAFLMIVPNHAGADLYRFDGPAWGKGEFYARQIAGTANYRCGGDGTDLLHGWLNYQIEHHVWPDLTLRQYRLAQPRLKAVCERYGVPYVQESVFRRFRKMAAIALGDAAMRRAARPGDREAARDDGGARGATSPGRRESAAAGGG
jgi:fatty acid desaturase